MCRLHLDYLYRILEELKKKRLKEILEEKMERKLKTETDQKCFCFSLFINLKNRHKSKS